MKKIRKGPILGAIILAFSNPPLPAAGNPPELIELQQALQAAKLKVQVTYESAKQKLDQLYLDHLDRLRAQAQEKGALEEALSLLEETKRFSQARQLSHAELVARPANLHDAQKKYLSSIGKHEKALVNGQGAAYRDYAPKLEPLRLSLTRGGRLEDALAVNKELDRARGELESLRKQALAIDRRALPIPLDSTVWNGHHYKVFLQPKINYDEAVAACEKLGGHLAFVESSEERKFLFQLREKRGTYWIGASDEKEERDWRFLDGKEFPSSLKIRNNSETRDFLIIDASGVLASRARDGEFAPGEFRWVSGYICEWDR